LKGHEINMENDETRSAIGQFHLESGKLILTDPGCERGSRYQGIIEGIRPGTWIAELEDESGRFLEVHHRDCQGPFAWEPCGFQVGVDSGLAGVWDEARYPVGKTGRYGDLSSFYGQASRRDGCMDFGVACCTGLGDGLFSASLARHSGEVVAVRILFLEAEDETDPQQ
jgi:hypothetical protein